MGRSPPPISLAAVLAPPLLPGQRSAEVFVGGDLEIRLYAPKRRDPRGPHDLDELYIVAAGTRHLRCGDRDDFAAWVIFYGPQK
jgi:hypothetical protein